jgi:hypothetical protein
LFCTCFAQFYAHNNYVNGYERTPLFYIEQALQHGLTVCKF